MKQNSAVNWLWEKWIEAIPQALPSSVVEWARQFVKLIGSARSESFDPDITPWTREPIECANDGTHRMTFVGPIQSGKTSVGEIALLYWLALWQGGDVQYNWQNDVAADARWSKHTEKKIRACEPVMARTSTDRFKFTKGLVVFPHCNFIQQGVFTDRNVASDSIRGQVNEEIHDEDGWLPGRLEQAYGRCTAFWNYVIFNISNAGKKGSQLHKAWLAGTQQAWEVRCPGCGLYHRMRTRWEDEHPELGGLRYDSAGCRLSNGGYDYNRLAPTIFYQMPCEYTVREDQTERRALSLSGRYSTPDNPGAPLTERSFTLEAVSIDYIPWVSLIQQKHQALMAREHGDPKPWGDYLRERECRFIGDDDLRRPTKRVEIILSKERKKNRAGLSPRAARYAALDRQKGVLDQGELPHWWLLIQDWDEQGNSLIVWEGRCVDDEEAAGKIKEHEVDPLFVVVDSSWDSQHVYEFCLKYGFCCIKVEGSTDGTIKYYSHEDGSQRIYSTPQLLHVMQGMPATNDDPAKEPRFWRVSKWGLMEKLEHVRASKSLKWEVPNDVSDDFKEHMASWQVEPVRVAGTNEIKWKWKQLKDRDDLYQCAGYLVMMADMDRLIGMGFVEAQQQKEELQPA